MISLARLTFFIGAVTFVFIGALHTYVHLSELAGPGLARRFEAIGPVALQGDEVSAWDLFQGVSLLMGFFSAALGLVLLAALKSAPKGTLPDAAISAVVMVLLGAITAIDALYLSSFQVVGGLVGILLFSLPFGSALRG